MGGSFLAVAKWQKSGFPFPDPQVPDWSLEQNRFVSLTSGTKQAALSCLTLPLDTLRSSSWIINGSTPHSWVNNGNAWYVLFFEGGECYAYFLAPLITQPSLLLSRNHPLWTHDGLYILTFIFLFCVSWLCTLFLVTHAHLSYVDCVCTFPIHLFVFSLNLAWSLCVISCPLWPHICRRIPKPATPQLTWQSPMCGFTCSASWCVESKH